MDKLKRLFRHLFTTKRSGKHAFPEATLQAIQKVIAEGEKQHRAEVQLIVEPSMPLSEIWEGTTARERAIELFAIHGIWDTEENSGILIYIDLADHQVEIVTDRGIKHVTRDDEWQSICRTMTSGYAQGNYHDSTIKAVKLMNEILHEHLPDTENLPNQLPNRPIIL